MTPAQRHDRLATLFTEAAALRPADRETFLGQYDLSDSLRTDLVGLLRHHETLRGPDFTGGALRQWLDEPPEELPAGTRVGPYVIDALLGRGGGGAVYAARQTGTLERDVALKLLDLPEPIAQAGRFAAERNAMAMLSHPNIARVFDADIDALGRAYIAMERVAGEPITEWHRRCKPTVRQTIAVILQAAEALEHAHGRGVIHRDVKPSNLLVAGGCNDAQVKVIDFGLVTAAAGSTLRRWLGNADASAAGTPLFMAPEQAAPDALPDVRADVYGLAAVLHTLLAGKPPLDLSDLDAALPADVFYAVRTRPRAKLTAAPRDVVALCSKALSPARRYENMTAFAADLRHYLGYEPIAARKPRWHYVARRFVRRNRIAVASAVVAALLLTGGLVGTALGFLRARAENERFRDQLAGNEAVNRFLADDLLGSAVPGQAGKDVRVADLLDVVGPTVGRRFSDRPLVEADLRLTMGETYSRLGRFKQAAEMLQAALLLIEKNAGHDDPQRTRALASLGLVRMQLNQWDQAAALSQAALKIPAIDVAGVYAHAAAHHTLALVDDHLGHWDAALDHADESILLLRSLFADGRGPGLRLAETLNTRALILDNAGRTEEAAVALGELPKQINDLLGPGHVYTAMASVNQAASLLDRQRHADALPLLQQALPVIEREFGPSHPQTLLVLGNLVSALTYSGHSAEAIPMAEKLAIRINQVHGPDSVEAITAQHRLASVFLSTTDRRAEAVGPANKAVNGALKTLGEAHWLTGQCFATRAYAYEARGDPAAARADLLRARPILARALGETNARVTTVDEHLRKLPSAP